MWVRDSAGSMGSQARNPGVKGRRVRRMRCENPQFSKNSTLVGDSRATRQLVRTGCTASRLVLFTVAVVMLTGRKGVP